MVYWKAMHVHALLSPVITDLYLLLLLPLSAADLAWVFTPDALLDATLPIYRAWDRH